MVLGARDGLEMGSRWVTPLSCFYKSTSIFIAILLYKFPLYGIKTEAMRRSVRCRWWLVGGMVYWLVGWLVGWQSISWFLVGRRVFNLFALVQILVIVVVSNFVGVVVQ